VEFVEVDVFLKGVGHFKVKF